MKQILFFGLLCTLAIQQTVLIASTPSNTIITFPLGQTVIAEAYHSVNNPNYIAGSGAKWIYKNGPSAWPDGDTVVFYAQFYADCLSTAKLKITADNIFSASLNGGSALTGNNWRNVYEFSVKLLCGLNKLVITTLNRDKGSPAALIFAVIQDQSACYTCRTPLAFYNRTSCSCKCLEGCNCKNINPRYIWQPYPICGCKCGKVGKCPQGQYWDDYSCSCKCKAVACLPNYVQDSRTCLCKFKCLPLIACKATKVWDYDLCKCVCPKVITVLTCKGWNEDKCSCDDN